MIVFDAHVSPCYPMSAHDSALIHKRRARRQQQQWTGIWPARMSHFLGTHSTKLDVKGRISIPAPYRAALRVLGTEGVPSLVLRSSHKYPCIECWPARFFAELAPPLDKMDVFDDDHDDLAMALYPDSAPFEPDKEGRIALPDDFVSHANLRDTVFFMGLGRIFQIWEPVAAERARTLARDRARQRGLTLRADGPARRPPQAAEAAP